MIPHLFPQYFLGIAFSSRISSGLVEAGFSIAKSDRICNKWFCITSRIIPNSSKYPPRPWVPKGSLNEIKTDAMLSRFHVGVNILFPNLKTSINMNRCEYDFFFATIHILHDLIPVNKVPQSHEILNHFFPKIMVNAVNLLLTKQRCEMITQLSRRSAVLSKGLLNNYSRPAPTK